MYVPVLKEVLPAFTACAGKTAGTLAEAGDGSASLPLLHSWHTPHTAPAHWLLLPHCLQLAPACTAAHCTALLHTTSHTTCTPATLCGVKENIFTCMPVGGLPSCSLPAPAYLSACPTTTCLLTRYAVADEIACLFRPDDSRDMPYAGCRRWYAAVYPRWDGRAFCWRRGYGARINDIPQYTDTPHSGAAWTLFRLY